MKRATCADNHEAISQLLRSSNLERTEQIRCSLHQYKIKELENLTEMETSSLFTTVVYHNGARFRISLLIGVM